MKCGMDRDSSARLEVGFECNNASFVGGDRYNSQSPHHRSFGQSDNATHSGPQMPLYRYHRCIAIQQRTRDDRA